MQTRNNMRKICNIISCNKICRNMQNMQNNMQSMQNQWKNAVLCAFFLQNMQNMRFKMKFAAVIRWISIQLGNQSVRPLAESHHVDHPGPELERDSESPGPIITDAPGVTVAWRGRASAHRCGRQSLLTCTFHS